MNAPVPAPAPLFVGVDVSKQTLDVCLRPTGESWSAANDPQGIRSLVRRLALLSPALIVLEATGGLEMPLLCALGAQGLPAAAVNPRQVRDFARGTGQLAKTDKIDAAVLAHFAEAVQPKVPPLPSAEARLLAALSTRREQLVQMITMEKNHRASASVPLRRAIERTLRHLEKELEKVDADMDRHIRDSPMWKEKDELLRSVPGVGPVLARTILADLPEIGTLDKKQIAALVGVAPFPCDSGKWKGQRHIWGGRSAVRCKLYMSSLSAIRFNPVIRKFHQRLLASGKANKVVIVACMHKLLTILNAMIRDGKPWLPVPA